MSRWFQFRVSWQCWAIGVCGPRCGCVVWTLLLGPLSLDFWPLAQKLEADF